MVQCHALPIGHWPVLVPSVPYPIGGGWDLANGSHPEPGIGNRSLTRLTELTPYALNTCLTTNYMLISTNLVVGVPYPACVKNIFENFACILGFKGPGG